MLKTGDKVKFLNDVGGGTVTGFQGKNIAMVENEDGFEIPVLFSQLVKVEAESDYEKLPRKTWPVQKDVEKKKEPEKKYQPEIIEGNDEPRFFLAFYPVNPKNPVGGGIELYLVNDSNFSLLYHFSHFDGKNYITIDTGELEPNTKSLLEEFSQTDLSDLPVFWVRILPFRKESKELPDPVIKSIRIPGRKFYKEKSFSPNDFFNGNALLYDLIGHPLKEEIDKLTPTDLEKVIEAKDAENRPDPEPLKKKVAPQVVEVDLHIHELVENWNGLSNREILDIQMDRFYSEMKNAMGNRVHRIVFIHGVGNGVLKQEIHKKLKSTYARFAFQDASFQEYGFGATLVILRRK